MSYTLRPVILTQQMLGNIQQINFTNPNPGAVRIINLSPYIIQFTSASGDSEWLGPGSVGTYLVGGQSSFASFTPQAIVNTVANFPVNDLYITVFDATDVIPTPGQYSLGIYQFGGTLISNEVIANFLDNAGLAAPSNMPSGTNSIIRVSVPGNISQTLFDVGPDGGTVCTVLDNGVYNNLFTVSAGDAFNPGSVFIQKLIIAGPFTAQNNAFVDYLTADGNGNLIFTTGTVTFNNPSGVTFAQAINAQIAANGNGQLLPLNRANGAAFYTNYNSGGPTMDLDVATTSGGAGIRLVYRDSTNALQVGLAIRQSDGRITNNPGDVLRGSSIFTGTGNGTFSHGLAKTPSIILLMQTNGTGTGYVITAITSTQCTVTWASGTPTWVGIAIE